MTSTVREEFEKWASEWGYDCRRTTENQSLILGGDYLVQRTNIAWNVWQAGRADGMEEAAALVERLTAHKRTIYAVMNNVPPQPCGYAAAIRKAATP